MVWNVRKETFHTLGWPVSTVDGGVRRFVSVEPPPPREHTHPLRSAMIHRGSDLTVRQPPLFNPSQATTTDRGPLSSLPTSYGMWMHPAFRAADASTRIGDKCPTVVAAFMGILLLFAFSLGVLGCLCCQCWGLHVVPLVTVPLSCCHTCCTVSSHKEELMS